LYSSFENACLPNSPLTRLSPYCPCWVFIAERNLSLMERASIQYQTACNHIFKNEKRRLYTQLSDDVLPSLLREFLWIINSASLFFSHYFHFINRLHSDKAHGFCVLSRCHINSILMYKMFYPRF